MASILARLKAIETSEKEAFPAPSFSENGSGSSLSSSSNSSSNCSKSSTEKKKKKMSLEEMRAHFSQSDDEGDASSPQTAATDADADAHGKTSNIGSRSPVKTASVREYYYKPAGLKDFVWAPVSGHFKNLDIKATKESKRRSVKNLFCGRIAPFSEGITDEVHGWPSKDPANEYLVEIFGLQKHIDYMHRYYIINRKKLHPFHDIDQDLDFELLDTSLKNGDTLVWDPKGFVNLEELVSHKEEKRPMVKNAANQIVEDAKFISSKYLSNTMARLSNTNTFTAAEEMTMTFGDNSSDDAKDNRDDDFSTVLKQITTGIIQDKLEENGKKTELRVGMELEYGDKIFKNTMRSKIVDIFDKGGGNYEVKLENDAILGVHDSIRLINSAAAAATTTTTVSSPMREKAAAAPIASKGKTKGKVTANTVADVATVTPEVTKYKLIGEFDIKATTEMVNKKRKRVKADGLPEKTSAAVLARKPKRRSRIN